MRKKIRWVGFLVKLIIVLVIIGAVVFFFGRKYMVKNGILKSTIDWQCVNYASIYSPDEPMYFGLIPEGSILSPADLGRQNLVDSDGKLTLKAGTGYYWKVLLYKEQVDYDNYSAYYTNGEFMGYYKNSFEDNVHWEGNIDANGVLNELTRIAILKPMEDTVFSGEMELTDQNGYPMIWTNNAQGDIVVKYVDGNMNGTDTVIHISAEDGMSIDLPVDFSEHRVVTQYISLN